MDDKLIEFTHLLRQNGLKVSVAENMDTFAALGLTGIGDRQILKDTLRATLVKRVVDIPVYDELFDLYFTGLGEIIKAASASTMNALEMSEEEFQRFLVVRAGDAVGTQQWTTVHFQANHGELAVFETEAGVAGAGEAEERVGPVVDGEDGLLVEIAHE